ncbi:MAG: tRNA epoxyqueuosine(34) reductase QueG [Proteobacteria bacterium]|nr:tRNA epoxyqueuosine(34) reductase QueG [Pseudomonadota bacterium]
MPDSKQEQYKKLKADIQAHALTLGFAQMAVSSVDLGETGEQHERWLSKQFHGEMDYMQQHGSKRYQPAELVPGSQSIISVRMNYWPQASDAAILLEQSDRAYISRYALGRDYHKPVRKRLQKLATYIEQLIGPYGYRVFSDSAPVMEKPIAAQAGLGWVGKHSNLINREEGSWFFLGEIYTDLPLPTDTPRANHCGTCSQCIDICPTQAIIEPYVVDARRCISYLTIELKGSIPEEFRAHIGNRIYGCDDCQLVCPWNRFAVNTTKPDFAPRHGLDDISLLTVFAWTEDEFLSYTEGSAIRRIGYVQWLRNIAIALGNADYSSDILNALQQRQDDPDPLILEHCRWAISQQQRKKAL